MVKRISLLVFLLTLFCLTATEGFSQKPSNKAMQAIVSALKSQETSWNNGDINGYMQYYWKSDSLKFITSKGITCGWQATLDGYKKSYPDKKAMGTLTFSDLHFLKIKNNLALVTGKWQLVKESVNVGGWYSLLWKKIKGNWLIIIDHTS